MLCLPLTLTLNDRCRTRMRMLQCLVFLSLLLLTSPESDKEKVLKELGEIQYNPNNYVIHNTRTDVQDRIDSSLWGGVNLKDSAGHIGEHLRGLANNELGVTRLQVRVTSCYAMC